jgi:O-phospho-L-seryl-tRNASec:L-selenocysteinyl-tRNA synthase
MWIDRYGIKEESSTQHQLVSKFFANLERDELSLLEHARIPDVGWSEHKIHCFLLTIAKADTCYHRKCGLGEREGRIACNLIKDRHYYMVHGIGRSGDLLEWQPKATGSSLLYQLTTRIVIDLAKRILRWSIADAIILPVATGMALFFALKAVAIPQKKKVIWFRADQKSAIKAVFLAGLELVPIDGIVTEGGEIVSNIPAFEKILLKNNNDIAAVISTTSCFAPRSIDEIVFISQLCKEFNLPHIVNNAYGLQSESICSLLSKALYKQSCRIDAIVQSGDKNFQIPVSCAIVFSPKEAVIKKISALYPGRASISGVVDLFISIMHMGICGWKKLIQDRKDLFEYLKGELKKRNFKIAESNNDISIAIINENENITIDGPKLFAKGISGVRTVKPGEHKEINGIEFEGWQSHVAKYPFSYSTVAVALGCTRDEIDSFLGMI